MTAVFYLSAVVAVVATALAITRLNAVHALLYLIVSLLAVAVIFYVLGAPFAAVLEVIVFAGAIMALFVFVVMMLNVGETTIDRERSWFTPSVWIGPAILSAILLVELLYVLAAAEPAPGAPDAGADAAGAVIEAEAVAALLFGPYLLAVEIASMLLLAGAVGAYRLGRGIDLPIGAGRAPASAGEPPAPPPPEPPTAPEGGPALSERAVYR